MRESERAREREARERGERETAGYEPFDLGGASTRPVSRSMVR